MNFFKKVKLFSQIISADFKFVFMRPKISLDDGVIINGNILELEIHRDLDRNVVITSATTEMEIINRGDGLVTMINPKYFNQSNSKDFSLTEHNSKYKSTVWCSSSSTVEPVINEAYSELIEALEDRRPIDKPTLTIQSTEKYKWNERIYFEFDNTPNKKRWEEISWSDLRKKSDQFWLSFTYRLPEEIYLLTPKLIEVLPECWKGTGQTPFYCCQVENGISSIYILETEPIFIDFKKAKIVESG